MLAQGGEQRWPIPESVASRHGLYPKLPNLRLAFESEEALLPPLPTPPSPCAVRGQALCRVPRDFVERREDWLERGVAGDEEPGVADRAQPMTVCVPRVSILGQGVARVFGRTLASMRRDGPEGSGPPCVSP